MKGFGDNKSLNSDKLNHPKREKDLVLKNKLDLAKNYFLSGDVLKAKKIYSQLINSGISSYDLFFSYALFSRNCSEFQIAKKLLFQSISRYPTKVDHYILLAEILRLEKDFKKAQCAYQNQSIRVSAKKRDELQNIIQLVKNSDIDTPINFGNFRH